MERRRISIDGEEDLLGLMAVARVVRFALRAMKRHVRAGVATRHLDEIAAAVFARQRARSAPSAVYGFPAATCISVNDEIVHGIPSRRILQPNDLVTVDVTAEKNGYVADAAVTVCVPPVSSTNTRLIACAEAAFAAAMHAARAGNRVNDIGRAVELSVRRAGFVVVRELCGHGVGRTIHEEPTVPNYDDGRVGALLTSGLVLAVEPIVADGNGKTRETDDGWTIASADGGLTAHYEHTIVITDSMPIVLTAD